MKHLLAAVVAFTTITSCATVKHEIKEEITNIVSPPKPVGAEEIVLKQLNMGEASLCYTTKDGVEFRTDGRVKCPDQKEVEWILEDSRKGFKLKKGTLESLSVFYTADPIDCGGQVAMGCTQAFADGTAMSVVSLYYPWRRMILRHELTHVWLFWTGAPEMRHFCLDNPSLCDEKGESLILPI